MADLIDYDDLPSRAVQAERRQQLETAFQGRLATLDLAARFEAEGRVYVEEIDGELILWNA